MAIDCADVVLFKAKIYSFNILSCTSTVLTIKQTMSRCAGLQACSRQVVLTTEKW